MVRNSIKTAIAGALLLGMATSAYAGEFGNNCAYNLAQGKVMQTSCGVNATLQGKTYCFLSEDAMSEFMQNYMSNLTKAQDYYSSLRG